MSNQEDIEVGVEDLKSLIKTIQDNQITRIRRLVNDFASSFNMSDEDVLKTLFPEQVSHIAESGSAVRPKYENPENPKETWSGRGKTPLWMLPYLEQGKSKEDFLIVDNTNS